MLVVVHGEIKSKELITLPQKFGIGLPFRDVLDLQAAWAVSELNKATCKTKCLCLSFKSSWMLVCDILFQGFLF